MCHFLTQILTNKDIFLYIRYLTGKYETTLVGYPVPGLAKPDAGYTAVYLDGYPVAGLQFACRFLKSASDTKAGYPMAEYPNKGSIPGIHI